MRSNPNDTLGPILGFVKGGDQLFVTLGRNVGTEPLSSDLWSSFVDQTIEHVSNLIIPAATFGPFFGQGQWTDAAGVTISEESAVVSFTVGYTVRIEDLQSILAGLAATYGQDAIAWSAGSSHLVKPHLQTP